MALQTAQAEETEQTTIHNLLSKQLTVTLTKVLKRGSGFNTTDADPVNFIASFESGFRQTGATDEAKDLLRHQVSSFLMSHQKTHTLLREEQKTLRELKADTEIVILPADKGRSTVILDKEDYRHKAFLLLNDRESYKFSDAASLKSLVAVVQKLERRLFEEYKPKFGARYVDDTSVIIDQDKINYYAEVLNSIIPDLKFTREEEVGDKLPFLDVLLCRQPNGELATSV
nr:unnamed protein product [Spirometra erinaceieuropaei]